MLAALLAVALIPVCYVLTMALFGAYLKNAKALPIAVSVIIAVVVFAAFTV